MQKPKINNSTDHVVANCQTGGRIGMPEPPSAKIKNPSFKMVDIRIFKDSPLRLLCIQEL